jgi:hypothetical protein
MLRGFLESSQSFLGRRRGDCMGSFTAGWVFMALAPHTEDPVAFRMLGLPLLIVGFLLTVFVISGWGKRK